MDNKRDKNPWKWLPALYFVEGLPNAIVGTLAVAYYKSMGMSNAKVAFLTSFLYLPWMLKGFWGPLVDSIATKRKWIFFCLWIFIGAFSLLTVAQFSNSWIALSAALFWLLGFSSATYDISADGFYMLALNEKKQSFFVGIRNAFYRGAVLFGQGGLMILAGYASELFEDKSKGWAVVWGVCSILLLACIPLFSRTLPYPPSDFPREASTPDKLFSNIIGAFKEFVGKPQIFSILAFVLFYRFAEAQLTKVVQPFMMDPKEYGGLGFSLQQMGMLYGTLASLALLCGGIAGGIFISRAGLYRSLWLMASAMNIPNIIYIYLAALQPDSLPIVGTLLAIEQFGYGFGFAGYMFFMIYASRGKNKTSSYAICTSLMALGLIIPGFFSGALQEIAGYLGFFVWVFAATSISFAVTFLARRYVAAAEHASENT